METWTSCFGYWPQYKQMCMKANCTHWKNKTMYNFCNWRTNIWENSLRVLLGLKCTEMLYLERIRLSFSNKLVTYWMLMLFSVCCSFTTVLEDRGKRKGTHTTSREALKHVSPNWTLTKSAKGHRKGPQTSNIQEKNNRQMANLKTPFRWWPY